MGQDRFPATPSPLGVEADFPAVFPRVPCPPLFLGMPIGNRPIVLLGILLTVMGVQFITMGLLGELLVRTYHESQSKPVYRVEAVLRQGAP